jgi:AAA+ ATPase superfamily predicted ATPase
MTDRDFVGRHRQLSTMQKYLDRVTEGGRGLSLAIRGRRQVGKSRLVQEFCDRAGAPYFYFTATKGMAPAESVEVFLDELDESPFPFDRATVPRGATTRWLQGLQTLAFSLPDQPSIVVIDELPWLAEQDGIFEGALQSVWDRQMSRKPVLLLLLGSDLHMMERLSAYDRPFFGRADVMVLSPMSPFDTAAAVGLTGGDAIDAHLLSGGLPGILKSWTHGTPPSEFLREQCENEASTLFVVPETTLLAEFPSPDAARRVLQAIGGGDRTFANIAASAGNGLDVVPSGTLSPILAKLTEQKHVVEADNPLSTQPGKPALYRIADTNLRFHLAIGERALGDLRRGRPDAALQTIERRWSSWRGRAVEPLIRDSLWMAGAGDAFRWPEARVVGGWWNRQFNPEVDIVGADRGPVAGTIHYVGSIKWLGKPFDSHDLAELRNAAVQVPGFDFAHSGLVVASLAGVADGLDLGCDTLVWTPEDVIEAYRTSSSAA